MLLLAYHDKQYLMVLFEHNFSVVEVLYLLGRRHIHVLVLWRLVVNWLVEVVHAENSEALLLVIVDVLLGQEVLVHQKFILVLVVDFKYLVIYIKVL